jgi:hypothetical protein
MLSLVMERCRSWLCLEDICRLGITNSQHYEKYQELLKNSYFRVSCLFNLSEKNIAFQYQVRLIRKHRRPGKDRYEIIIPNRLEYFIEEQGSLDFISQKKRFKTKSSMFMEMFEKMVDIETSFIEIVDFSFPLVCPHPAEYPIITKLEEAICSDTEMSEDLGDYDLLKYEESSDNEEVCGWWEKPESFSFPKRLRIF